MTDPLAAGREVRRRFGDVLAVDGVSLEVRPVEVLGLVGANGAGKTTLIRVLLGLLPATSGEVRLFGRPPSWSARRRVGYVPQGLGLYEDLTVEENLAFSAAAFDVPVPDLEPDLAALRRLPVASVPLGLQRRLGFAQALAHDPGLLVLDEPTSGVGPLGRARLWDLIRSAAERGAGVLVTTHSMEEAEQCDRLVVMAAGRVVAAGTVQEVIGGAASVEVRAEEWEAAFRALDQAGLAMALAGRSLRLPDTDPARVEGVLAAAGVPAVVRTVPATLDEAFVRLAGDGA